MTHEETLIRAIALREGTAKQLAKKYGYTVEELKSFVEDNRQAIEQAAFEDIASKEDKLWITDKVERLKRYQLAVDTMLKQSDDGYILLDSTILREIRSYLALAANELGQLMHRGSGTSGDGDSVEYKIYGIDLENLR